MFPIFISFFHLLRSTGSSLLKLCAWHSFCTTSFHVLFGLPLGIEPSTSYSIRYFIQSLSSLRNTCPYHHNLLGCSIKIVSSIPSLSLNSLLGILSFTLTLHTVNQYSVTILLYYQCTNYMIKYSLEMVWVMSLRRTLASSP